jgi:hypothetical protein
MEKREKHDDEVYYLLNFISEKYVKHFEHEICLTNQVIG